MVNNSFITFLLGSFVTMFPDNANNKVNESLEQQAKKAPIVSLDEDALYPVDTGISSLNNSLSVNTTTSSQNFHMFLTELNTEFSNKKQKIVDISKIRNLDSVESVIDSVTNDVFNKFNDNSDGTFFSVDLPPRYEEYKLLVDSVLKKLDLVSIFKECLPEVLLYGEYILKIDWQNLEIDDIQKQELVLPIFLRGKLKYVLDSTDSPSTGKTKTYNSRDFLVLKYKSSNKKLSLLDNSGAFYSTKLSKGLFNKGVISKILTLNVLESLIPIIETNNVSQRHQYYMKVPAGTSIESAYEACRKYELVLHSLFTQGSEPSNLSDMLSSITKIKVIPIFGDNSELSKNELPKQERLDLTFINDLRNSIATSLSVPPKFLNVTSDQTSSNNAKYLQLIVKIREELSATVKELVMSILIRAELAKFKRDNELDENRLIESEKYNFIDDFFTMSADLPSFNSLSEADNSTFDINKEGLKNNKYSKIVNDFSPVNVKPWNRLDKFLKNEENINKDIIQRYNEILEEISEENINVRTPKVRGSEELETIDYTQLLSQTMADVNNLLDSSIRTLQSILDNKDSLGNFLDIQSIVKFYNDKFIPITGAPIFKIDGTTKDTNSPEKNIGEISDIPSFSNDLSDTSSKDAVEDGSDETIQGL